MPHKSDAKKTISEAVVKESASARKNKSSTKTAATKKLAQQKKGIKAARAALSAAALTSKQKRAIAHQCIATCTGNNDFGANQPLSSIQPGREQCVQACVVQAAHTPIIVTPADSEISIAGRI